MPPVVSVIVVSWNRKILLEQCLISLERQTFQHKEVIVVDNGSTDGSTALVRHRFPEVRVIALPTNRGFSCANNIGIEAARGMYIGLLNNDARAEPGWLAALVAAAERYPSVGSFASKMLLQSDPKKIYSTGILVFTSGLAKDRGRYESDGPTFHLPGEVFGACAGAALYRKSMLQAIGLFDEDFAPAYFEDVDLSLRAQLRGYPCRYVPEAVVYHDGASTLGARSAASVYLWGRNQLYVFIKNFPFFCFIKHLPEIIWASLVNTLWHLARDGSAYLQGQCSAWRQLPLLLRKRRMIQRHRSVPIKVFEALMTPGYFSYARNRFIRVERREA